MPQELQELRIKERIHTWTDEKSHKRTIGSVQWVAKTENETVGEANQRDNEERIFLAWLLPLAQNQVQSQAQPGHKIESRNYWTPLNSMYLHLSFSPNFWRKNTLSYRASKKTPSSQSWMSNLGKE